jgi:patatin-like phospholipase/acyl hydrolase
MTTGSADDVAMSTGKTVRILSIDGGGYLGLATASLIEELERHFGKYFHESFDLFAGTSTGGLIALGLASGMKGVDLRRLYEAHGQSLFPAKSWLARTWRKFRQIFVSKYSNKALRKLLWETFGDGTLGDILERGKKVIIPAFCLTNGGPRVFKTDHAPGLTAHSGYRVVDVALATAAAPTFFPVVGIPAPHNETIEMFCDGGVFANDPALMAYAEALSELRAVPADIELLSISTPRSPLARRKNKRTWQRGVASWSFALPEIFVQGAADTAAFTLQRISRSSGSKYERIRLPNDSCLPFDLANDVATNALKSIGLQVAQLQETREKVSAFLRRKEGEP